MNAAHDVNMPLKSEYIQMLRIALELQENNDKTILCVNTACSSANSEVSAIFSQKLMLILKIWHDDL